ncbi:hypothetical protein [Lentzea atacamensis]|uniref:hypothetical protein n=1 Tax=Lentzea atacamensis TaxID=531938 RepID=UPI000DD4570D|nr:hypothetical protein [Lentzea atacamensis]
MDVVEQQAHVERASLTQCRDDLSRARLRTVSGGEGVQDRGGQRARVLVAGAAGHPHVDAARI